MALSINGVRATNVSQLTLSPSYWAPELYMPLWWYSGGHCGGSTSSNANVAGNYFVIKGNSNVGSAGSSANIFTLNNSCPATTKFSFECSFMTNNSGTTAYVGLWDVTSNVLVSASQISTSTITTLSVMRSGQFTLTPGHTYAITMWSSAPTSGIPLLTDASLIIFPQAPLQSPSVSAISLANPSGNTLKEIYIPLWMMSSGTVSTTSTSQVYIQKGSTSTSSTKTSATTLHTLNTNWSPSQKFAFEASIYSGYADVIAYIFLYDLTTSTVLTEISTSAYQTATLIRTGTFTATPGHALGIAMETSSSSYAAYLSKASLVALGP